MNNLPRKSFGIVRVRPYSLEGGCIVYVELPENAKGDWLDEDVRLWERFWEDIIGYCEKIRGSIYPVMVLSTDGRRLLRIRRLKGTLFLPEGVEEVADYAATDEDDNEISRIVWNGSIRRIGKEAFWKAVTNAVVLPPTVESVGDRPFSGDYIVSCQCHFGDTVDKNQSAPSSVRRYKNYRRFLDDMAWIGHICRASSCIAAVYAHYPKTDQKIPLNDLVLTALLYWPFADIMSLIDAVEREMPGRISKVKDALGNNALWYLMMKQHGPYFLPDGRYRFGWTWGNLRAYRNMVQYSHYKGWRVIQHDNSGETSQGFDRKEDDVRDGGVVHGRRRGICDHGCSRFERRLLGWHHQLRQFGEASSSGRSRRSFGDEGSGLVRVCGGDGGWCATPSEYRFGCVNHRNCRSGRRKRGEAGRSRLVRGCITIGRLD